MKLSLIAISLASAIAPGLSATYSVSDSVVGSGSTVSSTSKLSRILLMDEWNGSESESDLRILRYIFLRTDFKTVLNPSGAGRNSVRIRSKKTYTTHVAVFNMRHMPQGCGTWPAVWETVEATWPNGGEVDIVEGVNDQSPNAVTLHTSPGCTMPASRAQSGTSGQLDCNTAVNGNAGCGVRVATTQSYGPAFNNIGGGWYVVERSATYIKVWFWARNDGSVPAEVKNGASTVNPDNWGVPAAYFPNTSCDFPSHFSAHNIIINLTLCGDWAGSVYSQSGCPSTCVDFVNNNPSSFSNAFFDFASIRVYQ
ncbi:concanavalin A-like lectin/glucanase domain-containing protein [Cyathus striatus]|nr:concanavalin A-like lectin/glucanase domain-containing protein [Cyathus striatus]